MLDEAVNATPATITELITFQQSGITSRTLIESAATTVTLFGFAAGQALSEHTTPFYALVQVVEGELEIRLGGDAHMVKAGQVLVMPPDVPHALRAHEKSIMILTMAKK